MRLIPRGKPLYEELPTVFLNWEEMAQKLRADHFTGYIHVASEGKQGVILFKEGKISGSLFLVPGSLQLRGQEALTKTTLAIQERKGALSIYETSGDICNMIEWYFDGSQIYSPMESSFIDFDKFMKVMEEKAISGLIKVASDAFSEFIHLEGGLVKGHFVDSMPELQKTSETLATALKQKDTFVEVFTKADLKSPVAKLEMPEAPKAAPPPPQHHPEPQRVEFKPPEPIKIEPPPLPPPPLPKVEYKPPEPTAKVEPPATPGRPRLDFSNEDIDPFKPHGEFAKDEAPPASPPPRAEFRPPEPPKTEPSKVGPATTAQPPTGKIAFLLDGIKKVAQSNVGEDILPWLDGQISRMQSIQPNLSKRDLLLLVDEIERYVRTVRQNPAKATKLASQLRHIIESFAANLG